MTNTSRWTRRDFLRTGAAAAAIPAFIPGSALGLDGGSPASETVRVGVIGCGGRSRLIREAADVKGFQVVAACDCQVEKAERLREGAFRRQAVGAYADFRKMIEKEKLDAVMIETTTHARAWIAILAMQAGMHAYIEKPIALTVSEGRAMVRAARKFQRVTQVGTQQRSMPINNWASDLVKNGGDRQGAHRARPELHRPDPLDEDLHQGHQAAGRAVVGRLDEPDRVAALRGRAASRLGNVVGLRRRRQLLRRDRLGRPFLRPDQPRPGHRRHRARLDPPGRGRGGPAPRASSPPRRASAAWSWATRATWTRAPTTTAWRGSAARGPR